MDSPFIICPVSEIYQINSKKGIELENYWIPWPNLDIFRPEMSKWLHDNLMLIDEGYSERWNFFYLYYTFLLHVSPIHRCLGNFSSNILLSIYKEWNHKIAGLVSKNIFISTFFILLLLHTLLHSSLWVCLNRQRL